MDSVQDLSECLIVMKIVYITSNCLLLTRTRTLPYDPKLRQGKLGNVLFLCAQKEEMGSLAPGQSLTQLAIFSSLARSILGEHQIILGNSTRQTP